jgi:hypothetical protein
MSLAIYTKTLPSHFRSKDNNNLSDKTGDVEQEINVANPERNRKDFADITEIKSTSVRGESKEILLTKQFWPPPKRAERARKKFQEYSVLLRRTVVETPHGFQHIRNELEIQSESLQKAFRGLAVDIYENVDIEASPIKLASPYCELFFCRNLISEFVLNETRSLEAREEMKILETFILDDNHELTQVIKDHEMLTARGKITATRLWTI